MPVRGTAKPVVKLSDWEYVLDRIKRVHPKGEEFDTIEAFQRHGAQIPAYASFMAFRTRLQELGLTYQEMLYTLIVTMPRPLTVVETGVWNGISTRFIRLAMSIEGDKLYSCDSAKSTPTQDKAANRILAALDSYPMPAGGEWHFEGKRSVDFLLDVAKQTGGWDVFLADSDHKLENQQFELEFGWAMLKQGGLLICNRWDYSMPDGPKHGAFETFCRRRDLEWHTIGTAAVVEKGDVGEFEAVALKAEPSQLFQAAIAVAVADQRAFSSAAPPAYECYLK